MYQLLQPVTQIVPGIASDISWLKPAVASAVGAAVSTSPAWNILIHCIT